MIVAEADVKSVILAVEIVVVAKLDVPVTTNCPVVVELVTVKSSMNPTIAWKKLAKRLDDVALVVEALVEKRFVEVEFVVDAFVEVNCVIVPEAEVRSLIVPLVIVVVARVEVPITIERPEVVELPFASTRKLEFFVQAEPFQYSV